MEPNKTPLAPLNNPASGDPTEPTLALDPPETTPPASIGNGAEPQMIHPQMPTTPNPMASGPTPPDQPDQQTQLAVPMNPVVPPKHGKKRLVLMGLLAVLLLAIIGGAVAAYTGVIGPNNPNNIWASAMDNTGQGYDKLVDFRKQHQNDKGGEIKGTYKVDGSFKTDGSFEANWYDGNATGKIDIGLGTTRAKLDFRSIKSAGTYPDIYVQASGLKGLGNQFGSAEAEQLIDKINGQWVVVDHTLFDALQKQYSANQTPDLSQADIDNIFVKIGEALKTNIFTDDPSKAVLVVKQKVGKEQHDGHSTYHYKAGVDKQHLKDFVNTLKDKLNQTKLKDLASDQAMGMDTSSLIKDIDKMNTDKVIADVWVDREAKVFNAVRFYEDGKPNDYLEVGTPYTGGDDVPFVVKVVGKDDTTEANTDLRVTLNTKTAVGTIKTTISAKDKDSTTAFDLSASFKPYNTALNVQKPANAKSVSELFGMSANQLLPMVTPAGPTNVHTMHTNTN